MLFLHLFCKKEDFLSFTAWILLSSLGILLVNNLGARACWLKQSQKNHIIKTNVLNLANNCDHLNGAITEKRGTPHADPLLPINSFQNIEALCLLLRIAIVVCTQLDDLQTPSFSNQRAPPLV
ncbi:hypothetical protein [Bartonella rattaustraliani]|uniref:hypothetical protein n=1 Tax=Bartonella rattaustraliani TaxID=481139 RepID=UPI00030EF45A|nr:hypothetical protein [Bartonella rattaustraliani]